MTDSRERAKEILNIAGGHPTPASIAEAAHQVRDKQTISFGDCLMATYFHAVQAGFKGHIGKWADFLYPILQGSIAPLPTVGEPTIVPASFEGES